MELSGATAAVHAMSAVGADGSGKRKREGENEAASKWQGPSDPGVCSRAGVDVPEVTRQLAKLDEARQATMPSDKEHAEKTAQQILNDLTTRLGVDIDEQTFTWKPSQAAIQRFKALIQSVNPMAVLTETLQIPAHLIGLIIGKGGTGLATLHKQSGAAVNVPRGETGQLRPVELSGTPEQVQTAKVLVLNLTDQPQGKGGKGGHNANAMLESITVKAGHIGAIIGKKGAGLKEISMASGARLNIPRDVTGPTRIVEITGLAAQIAHAKEMIADRTATAIDKGPMDVEMILVPTDKLGLIIGKGGSVLKELIEKSGASIHIPRDEEDPSLRGQVNRPVKLTGAPEQLVRLKEMIYERVGSKEGGMTTMDVVHVHTSILGKVIGPKGVGLREIWKESGTKVNVPREGHEHDEMRPVELLGTPAQIRQAKDIIGRLCGEECVPDRPFDDFDFKGKGGGKGGKGKGYDDGYGRYDDGYGKGGGKGWGGDAGDDRGKGGGPMLSQEELNLREYDKFMNEVPMTTKVSMPQAPQVFATQGAAAPQQMAAYQPQQQAMSTPGYQPQQAMSTPGYQPQQAMATPVPPAQPYGQQAPQAYPMATPALAQAYPIQQQAQTGQLAMAYPVQDPQQPQMQQGYAAPMQSAMQPAIQPAQYAPQAATSNFIVPLGLQQAMSGGQPAQYQQPAQYGQPGAQGF